MRLLFGNTIVNHIKANKRSQAGKMPILAIGILGGDRLPKYFTILVCLIILINIEGCTSSGELPEGIKLIDNPDSFESEVMSLMKKSYSFSELIDKV